MIFVTLGTSKQPFTRLLKEIDRLIDDKIIKEKVIVQSFNEKYTSKNYEIIKMLSKEKYDSYIQKCNIIITHGGVGTILDGLKAKKAIIAFPRLLKYKEAVNDHQTQIIETFSTSKFILTGQIKELELLINQAKEHKIKEFKSNNEKFNNVISKLIDE